jgi:hypothetical protein
MSIGKLVVLGVALVLVSGGMGAALADWSSPEPGPAIDLVDADARKDDGAGDGTLATEEEGDGDDTAGDDGTNGGNTPQAEPAPVQPVQAAGDGDDTAGDDGTAGGDNTEAQPAPAQPVQAGGGDTDDGGGGAGGGGGGDTGGDSTD